MDPARLLRAARRSRGISQRELASHSGVPRSTIGRIEAGATDPKASTLAAILASVGYRVVLADQWGNLLEVDERHDRLRDAAFRRFPAHLPDEPVIGECRDGWWGWRRIAWLADDPRVPERTFSRRSRRSDDPYYADRRWDDAT